MRPISWHQPQRAHPRHRRSGWPGATGIAVRIRRYFLHLAAVKPVPAEEEDGRWSAIEWLMWQMGGVGPSFSQAFHFLHQHPDDAPAEDIAMGATATAGGTGCAGVWTGACRKTVIWQARIYRRRHRGISRSRCTGGSNWIWENAASATLVTILAETRRQAWYGRAHARRNRGPCLDERPSSERTLRVAKTRRDHSTRFAEALSSWASSRWSSRSLTSMWLRLTSNE